eukprot:12541971-Heterocapsa_arctica.AAC.2
MLRAASDLLRMLLELFPLLAHDLGRHELLEELLLGAVDGCSEQSPPRTRLVCARVGAKHRPLRLLRVRRDLLVRRRQLLNGLWPRGVAT